MQNEDRKEVWSESDKFDRWRKHFLYASPSTVSNYLLLNSENLAVTLLVGKVNVSRKARKFKKMFLCSKFCTQLMMLGDAQNLRQTSHFYDALSKARKKFKKLAICTSSSNLSASTIFCELWKFSVPTSMRF